MTGRTTMAILAKKLTTAELAGELGRSPETIIRWRRLRQGPPYLRVQGRVMYDAAEVEAWLNRQRDLHSSPVGT
jgi:transcriptional regulator with XRE-family HTH domain